MTRYTPYAHMFDKEDGYFITARSKAGLVQKAKALARNGEADGGALLFDPDDQRVFGEIWVGGPDKDIVRYCRK